MGTNFSLYLVRRTAAFAQAGKPLTPGDKRDEGGERRHPSTGKREGKLELLTRETNIQGFKSAVVGQGEDYRLILNRWPLFQNSNRKRDLKSPSGVGRGIASSRCKQEVNVITSTVLKNKVFIARLGRMEDEIRRPGAGRLCCKLPQ